MEGIEGPDTAELKQRVARALHQVEMDLEERIARVQSTGDALARRYGWGQYEPYISPRESAALIHCEERDDLDCLVGAIRTMLERRPRDLWLRLGHAEVTHNDFAELKLELRTDESWLPGSLVSENTDDSILFMTAGETRSGGYYVKATRVMMVQHRIVVFTLIQWSDAHVPAAAPRQLMDDWRSQCRDANRVESDLVDRLILAFSTGGDSPHAGAETSTDPPIRVGWGIKREDDRRLRQPGQRANSVRKPRSWRAYPILWLSSNAKPLLIGVGVFACLVIAGFYILWLLVPAEKGAESEEASERHGHSSAVDDSSATQVGDEVTAMANDQAEAPRTGDQR